MTAITFANLAPDDLERVANFASLPLHASLSYRRQIQSRWVDEIKELLSNENAVGFVAQAGATVCGLAVCAPLAWESPLLGKSMWTIKHICVAIQRSDRISIATGLVGETLRRIGARDADFLLCKAMPSDTDVIYALESNGFLLIATSSDVELLAQVAHSSFAGHFGRFHADPRIGHAAATKIYEEWIRSCANGWADWIVVAMHDDRIAGYSAWKKPAELDQRHGIRLGHFSIAAVHPDFSGRGLFTALTRAGMEQLCSSADWIEAPTHIDNHAVQRGFLRLGWRIAGAQHSFHKWLKS